MYLCLPEFVENGLKSKVYSEFLNSGTIFDFRISADRILS